MNTKSKIRRFSGLSIFVFLLLMSLTLAKPAEVKAATDNDNYQEWMNVCHNMLVNFKEHHFRYGTRTKSSYESALKKKRRADCAHYVSWCLQQYGVLDKGDTFYVTSSGRLRKKGFHSFGSKAKVIRVNRRCCKTDLQPGDVVCWKHPGHVNIYAGRSSSGKRLWYDGGKVSTKGNHSGSRYKNTHAKALGYLNRRSISYIIRIKNL